MPWTFYDRFGQKRATAAQVPGAVTYLRKTTPVVVNTSVAATDLLGLTVPAGAMSTTGFLRLTAWGDWINNTGGSLAHPRFQVVLGGTTIFDTGTAGTNSPSALRFGWRVVCEIENLGSASSQGASLVSRITGTVVANGDAALTTGEGIIITHTPISARGWSTAEGTNLTAVNTAIAQALALNVINGSASASYETKLFGAAVEIF